MWNHNNCKNYSPKATDAPLENGLHAQVNKTDS